ncbi:MAG: UDP-glucose 4-epimerase GalE [Lachnospiraceae bacterium]|nr:UDP-glucose 4-epimerase GalE [Lachnospiraceae bacterium]
MKNVLVTGGLGYIGSHVCVELLQKNYNVVVVDDLSNSRYEVLDAIEAITHIRPTFYQVNVGETEQMTEILQSHRIDVVIHLAAYKSVEGSIKNPQLFYDNNVTCLQGLLQAMQKTACRNIVFSSSATVYGKNTAPYVETMELSAVSPYAQTKIDAEEMLQNLCKADDSWSVVVLRYFNAVGAHKSGQIGELPTEDAHNLFPCMSLVVLQQKKRLKLYGKDYNTPDGTAIRDYVHVCDLAKGHLAAIDYSMSRKGFDAINLGTGIGYSVLEMLRGYEAICERQIPYEVAEQRPGDVAVMYADVTKAREKLGWQAELGLEEMCRDSWEFVRIFHGGK